MKELSAEDKELLLKDLCAKLPYGVRIWHKYYPDKVTKKFATSIRLADTKLALSNKLNEEGDWYPIEESGEILIKPYLRPMSSMTEEECDMVEEILGDKCIFDFMGNGDIILKQGQFSQNDLAKLYSYYNSIHVDYHNLIPKGLAIDATNLNIY